MQGNMKQDRGASGYGRAAALGVQMVYLTMGCLLMAISYNMFQHPHQIAAGGVTGLSTVLEYVTGLKPAISQWLINVPLLLAGAAVFGRGFAVKTVLGSVLLPLCILLTEGVPSLTDNMLLAAIYGGIGTGLGLGLIFKGNASSGGFTIVALLLNRKLGIGLGKALLILDFCVIFMAAIVFTPEKALYAWIGLFLTKKALELIHSASDSKVAFIITDQTREETLRAAILLELDRGLTRFTSWGGYTGEPRGVLMVVLRNADIAPLKKIVSTVDPQAFVILSEASEVYGQGFHSYPLVPRAGRDASNVFS